MEGILAAWDDYLRFLTRGRVLRAMPPISHRDLGRSEPLPFQRGRLPAVPALVQTEQVTIRKPEGFGPTELFHDLYEIDFDLRLEINLLRYRHQMRPAL